MDKHELTKFLEEVDIQLPSSCEVFPVGGEAMILHFGVNRATRHVDALVLRGDVVELRQATRAVAQDHSPPDDWMSDGAKGFVDILPADFANIK